MTRFIIFSILLMSLSVNAQQDVAYAYVDEGEIGNWVFKHEKGDDVKIFVDETKVRDLPNLTASVTVDVLPQNKSVKIIEVTGAVTTLGERSANWFRVSYDGKTGFIWGGNLAIGYHKAGESEFVFGVPSTEKLYDEFNTPYNRLSASVKYFKNGNLIDEKKFDAGISENLNGQSFTVEKAVRLKNVNYTINASVAGEACAIPTYEQNYFVTNDGLISLPKTVSVSDAGVFHHSESIQFPSKSNKLKEQFLYVLEEAETDENDKSTGEKVTTTYSWDGEQFQSVKTKKEAIKS